MSNVRDGRQEEEATFRLGGHQLEQSRGRRDSPEPSPCSRNNRASASSRLLFTSSPLFLPRSAFWSPLFIFIFLIFPITYCGCGCFVLVPGSRGCNHRKRRGLDAARGRSLEPRQAFDLCNVVCPGSSLLLRQSRHGVFAEPTFALGSPRVNGDKQAVRDFALIFVFVFVFVAAS